MIAHQRALVRTNTRMNPWSFHLLLRQSHRTQHKNDTQQAIERTCKNSKWHMKSRLSPIQLNYFARDNELLHTNTGTLQYAMAIYTELSCVCLFVFACAMTRLKRYISLWFASSAASGSRSTSHLRCRLKLCVRWIVTALNEMKLSSQRCRPMCDIVDKH